VYYLKPDSIEAGVASEVTVITFHQCLFVLIQAVQPKYEYYYIVHQVHIDDFNRTSILSKSINK